MLSIKIEMTDNCIHLIFKVKQYKNANTANFVYYGKLDELEEITGSWNDAIPVYQTITNTGLLFMSGHLVIIPKGLLKSEKNYERGPWDQNGGFWKWYTGRYKTQAVFRTVQPQEGGGELRYQCYFT